MILAVASGKGGTGKTTLAVSLAQVATGVGSFPVRLLDCDVEAPNAALFLKPDIKERRDAVLAVPEVNAELCDHCGRCGEVCATNAIADVGTEVLVYPEMCIGCGVCTHQCPRRAIREVPYVLGTLEAGTVGDLAFAHGRLHVGRSQPSPVIRDLKTWQLRAGERGIRILDAPAGSSCPVLETVRGADLALLVTEPTPFGLHDLERAVHAVRDALSVPVAVVLNRCRGEKADAPVETFCRETGVPILLRIPFRREIAEAYAEGTSLVEAFPEWREPLEKLLKVARLGSAA